MPSMEKQWTRVQQVPKEQAAHPIELYHPQACTSLCDGPSLRLPPTFYPFDWVAASPRLLFIGMGMAFPGLSTYSAKWER